MKEIVYEVRSNMKIETTQIVNIQSNDDVVGIANMCWQVWPTGTGKTLPEQPPLEVENVITEPPAQSPKVIQKVVVNEKEQVGV